MNAELTRNNDPKAYYTFRDDEKEIEFKRHDMPTPWMNYLSNGTFHTMLSHAGGGVAFISRPRSGGLHATVSSICRWTVPARIFMCRMP